MTAVLVTGMSGTGKSSVQSELDATQSVVNLANRLESLGQELNAAKA